MNPIFNLRSFYKKGIHLKLYNYVDANLRDNLDNRKSTFSRCFISLCLTLVV